MFQNDKIIIYNDLSRPKIIDKICHYKNSDLDIEYSGSFVFGPLTHNFGLTIGNALRRVILSSSYGLAIIGFSVNSIDHEFNNLHGIIEDTVEIGLNLKSVRFVKNRTLISDGFLELDVQGPCKFTAGMLEELTENKVKVVDKELVICNIVSDSMFRFVFQITSGRGYVFSSFFKCFDNQRNLIFLDALFSGVKKVAFNVEKFIYNGFEAEKLTLDVETDCGLDYKDVISDAFVNLISTFTPFLSDFSINLPGMQYPSMNDLALMTSDQGDGEMNSNIDYIISSSGMKYNVNLFRTVYEIIIPVRAYNAFTSKNITYLGDLVKMSMRDLTSMANLGRKSLETVVEVLKKFGLKLEMDIQWPPVDLANLRKQCEPKYLGNENN